MLPKKHYTLKGSVFRAAVKRSRVITLLRVASLSLILSMEFHGTLFTYYEPDRLTAFESGPADSGKTVVFVGGLCDGYNSVPFLAPLQRALEEEGWSLIQTQLSSSYSGYGIVNLQKDCDELDHLIEYLKTRRSKSKIVVMGHSTGML